MSIVEFANFISGIYPFNSLSTKELEEVASQLDIVYFKKSEEIFSIGDNPEFLYFIIKGLIHEKNEDEVLSMYTNEEFFDGISVIESYSKHKFVAAQESICYALPRNTFIKILHENLQLENYFFQSISAKLNQNVTDEKNKELANIMVAKVNDAYIHKAVIIDYNTTIYDAAVLIKKHRVPSIILKDENNEYYIVTDSDFRQKVILNRMSYDDSVSKIASGNLIYVNENDFLFNAQLIMTKHHLKRLVVKNDNDEIVGIIDQISLSSFFATHTFTVSNEIDKAETLEELKKASSNFIKIVKSLYLKGVKVNFISKLINQLNKKLIDKTYNLLAPPELIGKSCLIVMGSEGRSEQIIRTDQDNALILSDDCEIEEAKLEEFTHLFTETLVDFGFPRCEGNIMVSNPFWCKKEKDFKDQIFNWMNNKSADDFMNLAIFYDAADVAGDKDLLLNLKKYLFKLGADTQSFFINFAKIILSFDVPLGFFDGFVYDEKDKFHKNELDIKRGGIFIVVQSIRALSLEHKILKTNTVSRIEELGKIGVLDNELKNEVIEAFNFLLTVKLKSNFRKMNENIVVDNFIAPDRLTTLEKDLLKDSFKIVTKLKKKIIYHYKLNYV